MNEKPIIFGGEMVRAILDGRKTQTRRVIKPQPQGSPYWTWHEGAFYPNNVDARPARLVCPYGQPGNKLWVRETWWEDSPLAAEVLLGRTGKLIGYDATPECYMRVKEGITEYRTDAHPPSVRAEWEMFSQWRRRSPIHMPRWASRLTLEITDVRAERIKELSWADAIAEGITNRDICKHCDSAQMAFREKWDAINAKRGYSWDSNPWVWAITFRVVTP